MTDKQRIAIFAPPVLVVTMIAIFRFTAGVFGNLLGWYLGLIIYWIIWGLFFSLWLIGKDNIKKVLKPKKIDKPIFVLMIIPILIVTVNKFIPVQTYQTTNIWISLMYLSTAFGNGFFEEIFWRGAYMHVFPTSDFYRIIWPSFWFALWHYAPGSVRSNETVAILIVGAGVFGLYLSYLAKKTNTAWWSIVVHTVSGIIMVV